MGAVAGPTPYAFNDTYARRAGFNEYAESNRLVVLYPQLNYGSRAKGAAQAGTCWDQSGQSGDDYTDKAGAQVKAVRAMVERLTLQRRALSPEFAPHYDEQGAL
jgi:poly(3-hydroxybutyrate) depolymerase